MSLEVTENYEGAADGVAISSSNSEFTSVNQAPKFSTDTFTNWPVQGTRSMKCECAGTAPHGVYLWGSDQSLRWVNTYYLVTGAPPANQTIFQAEANDGTILAQLRLLTDMKVQLRRSSSGTLVQNYTSTASLSALTAYRIARKVDAGNSVYRIKVYDLHSATPLFDSGDITYAAGAFRRWREGPSVSMTGFTAYYDALRIETATEPAAIVAAAVVDAGPAQTIQDTHTAQLDSTITGGTGGNWSVASGPSTDAGQFSNVAIDDPTFTPAGGPGTYTLVKPDSTGTVTDTVVVTVTALVDADRIASVTTATSWTASAGTVSDCLTDDDSDTYVTSSNNPTSLDLKFVMRGVLPIGGDATVTLQDLQRSGGTGTCDVSLYKPDGSTLVKKISGVTVPTVMADTVVTFAAADLTGVSDANWRAGMVVLVEVTAA